MKKILDYFLSGVYLVYFGLILVVFHGIQFLAFNLFGKKAHQKTVNALNFCICYGWLLTGTTIRFNQKEKLPINKSIIFIANHQSMFDIPGIIWYLRKHTPLFVSKIELSKGIPSISYNLRKAGAALIDRKDRKQAITEISRFGSYICENNFSATIFPEGTRSRDGKLKEFAVGGISILIKKCPEAIIVPIAIRNTGAFNPQGIFPLTSFSKLSWTCLEPIKTENMNNEEIVQAAKDAINTELGLS